MTEYRMKYGWVLIEDNDWNSRPGFGTVVATPDEFRYPLGTIILYHPSKSIIAKDGSHVLPVKYEDIIATVLE